MSLLRLHASAVSVREVLAPIRAFSIFEGSSGMLDLLSVDFHMVLEYRGVWASLGSFFPVVFCWREFGPPFDCFVLVTSFVGIKIPVESTSCLQLSPHAFD